MDTSETRTASDIYQQLQTLRSQLAQLDRTGRIVMARDSLNTDYKESATALSAALAGLNQAIEATTWMETLAVTDGGYPILEE